MSGAIPPRSPSNAPSISLDAAHAADKAKEITYPPRPLAETRGYEALRRDVLAATREARKSLGDA